MSKNKNIIEENCDGFTKRYISKSKTISDELRNDEIDNLMLLASQTEDYYEALNYYNQILEKYDYYKALNEKGFILIKLKEFNKAIDCFNKSTNLTKNNYDAHIGSAIAYEELLKLEDSINVGYELEIMANLRVACILNEDGYYYKYKFYKKIGEIHKSLKSLKKYLKNNPKLFYEDKEKYLSILFDRGELNFLLNNYYNAFQCFHQYLRFDEKNVTILMYMALVSPYFSRYDLALKCFDKVFEIDNTNFDAIFLKAELLINLHRYQEGIECFKICPIDKIPNQYKQLLKYAENQIDLKNETSYFGVTLVNQGEYNLVYTFIDNGLRKIYARNLSELRDIVYYKGLYLKKIRYVKDFNEYDYIHAYFKFLDLPVEYNDILSIILSNEFAKNLNDRKIDRETLLKNKTPKQQKIIKYVIRELKRSITYSHKKNYTGYFGVAKVNQKDGPHWKYTDWIKKRYNKEHADYYAKTLNELETIVKEKRLIWFVYNEDLAKKARKRDARLNKKN